MTETDLDTETTLANTEIEVRLPWESIDPPPVQRFNRSTSTVAPAVEAAADHALAELSAGLRDFNRFNSNEDDEVVTAASLEAEERFAAHAFFSDEIIGTDAASVTKAGPVNPIIPDEAREVENPSDSESAIATEVGLATHSASLAPVLSVAAWDGGPEIESLDASKPSATADESPTTNSDSLAPVLATVGWGGSPPIENPDTSESTAIAEIMAAINSGPIFPVREEEGEGPEVKNSAPSEFSAATAVTPAMNSDSLAPVLGGEGWGEGPDFESSDTSKSSDAASAKADPTGFFPAAEKLEAESGTFTPVPSPQPSPPSTGERESIADSSESESLPIEATPWATFDEVSPDAPASVDEVASLSADAITEASVTFSTHDSLLSSASELATLAESFGAMEIEEPFDTTVAVSANVGDVDGVFVVPTPETSLETQISSQTETETECELEPELSSPDVGTGGGWTVPLMCLGIGLIACCLVIPQGEFNRQLRYEQSQLQANLQNVQKQVAVNASFLKNVADDPTLAERLAGRQMKTIRKGQTVVPLQQTASDGGNEMSPFALVAVSPPPTMPPYQPKRSTIADLCNNARSRLYLLGSALAMVAVGLVMGFSPSKE